MSSLLIIGCGSGVPTMELAKLSDGEIIGIDIDQELLDILSKKIEEEGLTNRVKAVKCSLLDIKFPDNSFDVIWAEGSITSLGVEKSLKKWNRLIKPEGFLVVHDERKHFFEKLLNTFLYQRTLGGKNIINHLRLESKIYITNTETIQPLLKC